MSTVRRLIRGVLRGLGFDGARLGRYLLLMPLAGAGEDPIASEPLERYLFERRLGVVLQKLRINCVLDVGANRGQYGLALRQMGYSGHIVSFEPVRDAWETLRTVASRDHKWTTHHLALGAANSRAPMHVAAGSDFSSFLVPTAYSLERFPASAPVEHVENVEVCRLDHLLASVTSHIERPRFFLKMDTQGYDLQVFAGAQGVVDRLLGLQSELAVVPLYEHIPTMLAELRAYQAAGFEVSELAPVSRDPSTARVLEYDCLMLRIGALHLHESG
ncbi:MAG TPA: FkbM family methyltransferase [Gemmatimonadales bacterium]|nr:FkbM family methyltransferase [Gemmatimonadales bacterium]